MSSSYLERVYFACASYGSFSTSLIFFHISATSLAILDPIFYPLVIAICLLFSLKKKKKLDTGCLGLFSLILYNN